MTWKNASQDVSEDSEYHEYHVASYLSLYVYICADACVWWEDRSTSVLTYMWKADVEGTCSSTTDVAVY